MPDPIFAVIGAGVCLPFGMLGHYGMSHPDICISKKPFPFLRVAPPKQKQ